MDKIVTGGIEVRRHPGGCGAEVLGVDLRNLDEDAMAVLQRLRRKYPFELREIYLEAGDERFERFKEQFPVIFVNQEFAFCHRIPEAAFLAMLQQAGDSGTPVTRT